MRPRLAALATCLLVMALVPARAVAASDLLPDVVATPPDSPSLDNYTNPDGSHDLLLRFNGYIHNAGAGALDIRASRTSSSVPMPPQQRIYRTDGTYHDDPMPSNAELFYSNADGHNHWHLQNVAKYSLWDQTKASQVAPAMKVGFCLDDSTHVDSYGPATGVYTDQNGRAFCQQYHPDALSLFEGVSSGWRDIYESWLAFQWVVVSDVQPGEYYLREDVDPTEILHESDEVNPPAWSTAPVTIPGYVAKAITAPPGAYAQAQVIGLDSDRYGSPGARMFRIVTPPAHGTLSVPTGTSFPGSSVTYTPAPGYSGPDQFTYEALDSTSPYPIHPGTAAVALTVGAAPAPRVVIENAPTAMDTGTGVQLKARVSNDFTPVTWSVDGVAGGTTVAGRITQHGFYTAPAEVPPGGKVTISARTTTGAHDQRVIRIIWSPPRGPSPGTGGGHGKTLLGPLSASIEGRWLAASVTPRRAGIVSIRARIGKHRLGSCSAKDPRGRRFTCRIHLSKGLRLRRLKITARLIRHHRVIALATRFGRPPHRQ